MLRNKEVRRFAAVFALLAVVFAAAGFAIAPAAGVLAVLSAAAFGALFALFTKARYQRLAEIAAQIDLVLHDADALFISEETEGELSILQSEITKMTLRIREQNAALQREKTNLADSLADVAHQLRTPLTSANLILTLLKNTADENERKALLREAAALFAQMDRLLTALLKLSRLDAGIVVFQKEPVGVAALVTAALQPLQIPMELHNVTVEREIGAEITIEGDFNWLTEAVENILKNCMESMSAGGVIQIECTDTPIFTELAIHDGGPGIRPEDLPNLFDRFYRGKNTGTAGYGIGLALCKTILVRQGGSITAKNHPQGGAVFTLRFPK
ncbi:MAG: HAMP domain-containing sensor histidine kinase [Gemmiger sp.]|nr:HAMP domain-containing sensor histidine kinase [Gemmiger sp.]